MSTVALFVLLTVYLVLCIPAGYALASAERYIAGRARIRRRLKALRG